MNTTIALLKTRRSAPPPMLGDPGPSRDDIETILAIASRVPDHGKLAPWRFIVFEGEARRRAGEIFAEVQQQNNPAADDKRLALERQRFSAPVVIAVVSRAAPHVKIPEWEQLMSAGAVCMNTVTAANALGFATSWLTEWYAYDRGVLDRLGLAPNEKLAGFIHVGTPKLAEREDRVRPALADLITHFGG